MSSQSLHTSQAVSAPEKEFWCRDLVSICDLSPQELKAVIDLAGLMKAHPWDFRGALTTTSDFRGWHGQLGRRLVLRGPDSKPH